MRWPKRGRKTGSWLTLPLGGLLAAMIATVQPWEPELVAPTAVEAAALNPLPALDGLMPAAATLPSAPAAAPAPGRQAELRRGQTLGAVFAEVGLTPLEAHQAAEAARRFVDPRQLRPGARWAAYFEQERLTRFDLALAGRGELSLARAADGWTPTYREFAREQRVRTISGTLDGSLEASIAAAGADPALAYAMAEILQWDLDFTRDLQNGDRFRALFEETWIEGRFHELGPVLALDYGHENGRGYEAYRFGTDGYYDGEGRPLQKLFLRSPLTYSRITSRFSHRRFHPVLKSFRPHYGVDYGAPTGTPVRVTASGTVTSAGWAGGGGRTVKVRHPNGYLTCYLHLSRFAAGIRPGARVRQGDVVAYVGATGLATAPHLDYRVQRDGRWIDPLSLASVPAAPLTADRLTAFRAQQSAMRLALDGHGPYPPPPAAAPEPVRTAAGGPSAARSRH